VLKRHGNFRVNVHFSEEIDNEDKLTVNGNELLLRTALVNLIDNGCKYSEDHTVEVHFSWLDRDVIIQFSDRGIGIPPGEINLIFQPFYRARNAIGIKGHGIGLSLVEKIITLHGGEITIVSEENKGTDISIRLHTAGYPA
jgi:two-component system sensor histidine kinase ArlS